MTDFTPEHYLAAARIAYPEYEWRIYHPSLAPPIIVQGVAPELWEFTKDLEGNDYRALREALDKYGVSLHWLTDEKKWSFCVYSEFGYSSYLESQIEYIVTDDPVEAMMLAVVALVEAGVVE